MHAVRVLKPSLPTENFTHQLCHLPSLQIQETTIVLTMHNNPSHQLQHGPIYFLTLRKWAVWSQLRGTTVSKWISSLTSIETVVKVKTMSSVVRHVLGKGSVPPRQLSKELQYLVWRALTNQIVVCSTKFATDWCLGCSSGTIGIGSFKDVAWTTQLVAILHSWCVTRMEPQ